MIVLLWLLTLALSLLLANKNARLARDKSWPRSRTLYETC